MVLAGEEGNERAIIVLQERRAVVVLQERVRGQYRPVRSTGHGGGSRCGCRRAASRGACRRRLPEKRDKSPRAKKSPPGKAVSTAVTNLAPKKGYGGSPFPIA